MKMLNTLEVAAKQLGPDLAELGPAGLRESLREGLEILLRLLYPVVPHITDHLWFNLGYGVARGAILNAQWPVVDEAALSRDLVELMLQINGKLRGSLSVAATASQEEITAAALSHDSIAKFGEGRPIKKTIVVPGRLVNVVV